ncbi:prolyl hydroxylase family protein [Jeotgalibacillus proteolyticus]|uniref:prolyl hydroxylase family protein n=1 Tax=Jeotgalibacillus proteolyticus TaxID=2082395 RepID=UPI003CFA8DDF
MKRKYNHYSTKTEEQSCRYVGTLVKENTGKIASSNGNSTEPEKASEQHLFDSVGSAISVGDTTIPFTKLHMWPLVVLLENVLSHEECDQLIELSGDRMKRSKISSERVVNQMRTSSGMFFEESENDVIGTIEKRLSKIMNIPVEHAEGLQILNYTPGQEYKAHHDFFLPTSKAASNNRISTMVVYLNDVEEGGETYFPDLNITVTPKKGSAVYFEYFYNDEELNEKTLHGGAPVVKGEKWVATQWMRRKRVR